MTFRYERRADGYWLLGGPEHLEMGPYKRLADAREAKRGAVRFYKFGHIRSFVTCEPKRKASVK